MILFRGSGPVLLENLYYCDFSGGGGRGLLVIKAEPGGGGIIYMAFSWRAYDGPTLKAGLVAL